MTSSFFITGAAGCIGRALTANLVSTGNRVVGMDHAPQPADSSGIPWVTADILDKDAYADRLVGIETVVHLAAKVHMVPRLPREADQFWRINLEGTKTVIQAAARAGVRRFVFASTVAVLNSGRGTLSDAYAESKRAAEEAVLEFKDRLNVIIIRPATVYGPNDKGNVYKLIRWIDKGLPPIIGPANNKKSLVSVRTLADAILFLAARGENGNAYVVTDGRDYSMNEIVGAIFRALGRRNWWPAIPLSSARVLVAVNEWFAGKGGIPRILEKESIEKMVDESVFDPTPLIELGFQPANNFESGIMETVRWYLQTKR